LGERLLRNVLSPWLGHWWLRNILSPRLGNGRLRNVLNVSLFYWWGLDDIDVLNWICWRNNLFDGLVLLVLDIVPSRLDNSVIIEGVGIIEVLVRDSGLVSPRSCCNKISLNNNEVIVRVVIHEVGV